MSNFNDEAMQGYPFAAAIPPLNWSLTTVEDISMDVSPGFASGKHNSDGTGVPHLRPMNVDRDGQIDMSVVKFVAQSNGIELAPGDVLFNNTNSADLVGKTALATQKESGFAFSNHMTRIRPEIGVNSAFIARQLHFLWMSGYMKRRCTNHVNQASISAKTLAKTIPFLLPPATEQTRIVAKLEELLSDLDTGVAELKAAQKKLAQYRQSLLKAAVEGQLTADWRAQHPPTETGAELLARILQERRTRWEAKQLEKFVQQGKTPPKNWQGKYPEPIPPDTRSLPTLPEGWVWATLSQIGWLDRGRSKYRPRNAPHLYGGAYPFVQTGDIRHADTHLSKVEVFYSKAGLTQSRLWPAGTMCITIAANIGKTAILSMDACFPDSIVGFLPVSGDVSVRYVEYFMRSAQQKLEDEAPATAQKNINLEILEKVVIPLPPPIEQQQIVKSLDETMGGAKENNSAIEIVLKQTTAQRQNILRAAFAGELVPQGPSDEPASALLERIRAQRAAQTPPQKPRGRKKKEIQDV